MHCVRLALTQHLDVSTALVSRQLTHTVIDELVLLHRVNLSWTMLYTLLLRSWYCILPATLSIFVLHCSIQLCLHLSCVLLVSRTALCCFSSRGPLVALPAFTPPVAALLGRLVLQSLTRPCDATSPESDTFAVLVSCPDCSCCCVRSCPFF